MREEIPRQMPLEMTERNIEETEGAICRLNEFGEFIGICADRMNYAVRQYRSCQENELDIIRAIQ